MKYLAFVISIFFVPISAWAKCSDRGISCLSNNPNLNKNGLIILEFYASSQSIAKELNKKYPIFLKTLSGKVQLNVIEILQGEMDVTQTILKPASGLHINEVYYLDIEKLPKYEELPERYNAISMEREQLTFKIIDFIDNESPILNGMPTEQKKTLVYYGCGPVSWVYFGISGQDKSVLFVKTTVKNKTTGLTTTYILNIENGLVKVGHGMCSGAFYFDNGNNFEVVFQLFDQSGNKSNATNAILFTKPTDED